MTFKVIIVLVTLNNQLCCVRSFRVIMLFTLHDWVVTGWGSHTTRLKVRRNPQQDSLVSKPQFVRKNKQEVTLLHNKITSVDRYGLFIDATTHNHNSVPCLKWFSHIGKSSPSCFFWLSLFSGAPTHSGHFAC